MVSDAYTMRTGREYLYNIMPLKNIPSVITYGILCYERVVALQHESVAMEEVQSKRARVIVPNGLPLHRYANLYFDYRNPMMYKRKDMASELCILGVRNKVLDWQGCVVTDSNAASHYAHFMSPADGLKGIDFGRVYARSWVHDDPYEKWRHKVQKCAEILIPEVVPYSEIVAACVWSDETKSQLVKLGFDKPIVVAPDAFFRERRS